MRVRDRDEQLRRELERWQVPVPAIELGAVRFQNAEIRRPDVPVFLQERLGGSLAVVDLQGYAVGGDRVRDGGLWIRHGIQCFAAPSSRAENIQKDELAVVLGACGRVVK